MRAEEYLIVEHHQRRRRRRRLIYYHIILVRSSPHPLLGYAGVNQAFAAAYLNTAHHPTSRRLRIFIRRAFFLFEALFFLPFHARALAFSIFSNQFFVISILRNLRLHSVMRADSLVKITQTENFHTTLSPPPLF